VKLITYLNFNGNCKEAFEFYEAKLGGTLKALAPWADMPADAVEPDAEGCGAGVPEDWGDKIMHAELVVGDYSLMGADVPAPNYLKPQGFSVNLAVDSVAQAEKLFAGLAEGGTVVMPLMETFWAERFGMAEDKFGIHWMINIEKPLG